MSCSVYLGFILNMGFNSLLQLPDKFFYRLLKKETSYLLLVFNFLTCNYFFFPTNLFNINLLQIKHGHYLVFFTKYYFLLKRLLISFSYFLSTSSFGYFIDYEIRGRNFKVLSSNSRLFFVLGLSHIISYELPRNVQVCFINNKLSLFSLFSYDFNSLYHLLFFFSKLKKIDKYKGKGIFLKSFTPKLKLGKKKDF